MQALSAACEWIGWVLPLNLLELLGATRGMVCAVGAGGKKTTLYALARQHPGRLGLTTTTQISPLPPDLAMRTVLRPLPELLDAVIEAARYHSRIAFARPKGRDGRVGGVDIDILASLQVAAGFDTLLIKADGARMRGIKAPADHEPVLPPGTTTVLWLVSAGVLGRPLDERVAHRVERIEALTGARRDRPLRPEHLTRLLTHPEGGLRRVGAARVIPIINGVIDDRRLLLARRVAEQVLTGSARFDYCVLAAMWRATPIVEVIGRRSGHTAVAEGCAPRTILASP